MVGFAPQATHENFMPGTGVERVAMRAPARARASADKGVARLPRNAVSIVDTACAVLTALLTTRLGQPGMTPWMPKTVKS